MIPCTEEIKLTENQVLFLRRAGEIIVDFLYAFIGLGNAIPCVAIQAMIERVIGCRVEAVSFSGEPELGIILPSIVVAEVDLGLDKTIGHCLGVHDFVVAEIP